jgi:hypothetical protein
MKTAAEESWFSKRVKTNSEQGIDTPVQEKR